MFGWMSFVLKDYDLFDAAEDVANAVNNEKCRSYKAIHCKDNIFKNWEPYIQTNFKTIVGIKSWHLIKIEKQNKKVITSSKFGSQDLEWDLVEHTKNVKPKPFILKNIESKLLPPQLWKYLNSLLNIIPDEIKRNKLIE